MACQANPPAPAGYQVWRGNVPTELTQWAMDLRDHVSGFPYGQTWTLPSNGQTVLARKDHHTWTWRGGQLVTGLCIPGITLYAPASPTVAKAILSAGDPLAGPPDPTAAVFGAEEVQTTDWGLVAVSGLAIVGVLTGFWAALRLMK